MRILLTTISLDPQTGGGCAGRTYHLARHLRRLGHQCTAVSIEDGAFAGRLRREGVEVHAFGFTRLRFHLPHLRFAKLAALVREADVVHILGYWNMLSVATAFLAARMGKPYLFSAAGEFVGLEPPVPSHKRTFHRLFGRRMVRNASGIVAITALEKEQIIDRLGVAPRLVDIVPNGVEPPETAERGETPPPLANPYILFVGRLASVKGPDLLVEAFARVADAHPAISLVMGGPDCGMRAELETTAARHGLSERILFTGHLEEAERSAAYRGALFLVVPSRSEAMSLVALEAGMLATPVLLTESCGFDEVGAIGGGMTVATSVDGLAHGLGQMLARPAALAAQGDRLQDYAMRNFAWPKVAAKLLLAMQRATKGPDRIPAPYRRATSSLSTPAR